MKTQSDALAFIASAIEVGNARADEFDLEAIANTLHNLTYSWDFSGVDTVIFWAVVLRHVIVTYDDCPYCEGRGYQYNTPSRPSIHNIHTCGDCGGSGIRETHRFQF